MARKLRVVVAGQPLHIIQRGVNREPIFFSDDDYWRYLNDLKLAAKLYECKVHAYVLMTNHVHIIATGKDASSPGKMMQSLGRRYVRFINLVYQRTGTLWEGRFKSGLIDSESYLMACYRYVELNPVRAKMVEHPAQYPWSSYHHNALGKANEFITFHDVYLRLSETPEKRFFAYRKLVEEPLSDSIVKLICEGTQKESIIGNDKFRKKIEKQLKRRLSIAPHGGDRRSGKFQVH